MPPDFELLPVGRNNGEEEQTLSQLERHCYTRLFLCAHVCRMTFKELEELSTCTPLFLLMLAAKCARNLRVANQLDVILKKV